MIGIFLMFRVQNNTQDVIGHGHNPDDVLPEGEPPLGRGLILQKEIKYFREARDGVVSSGLA